MLTASKTPLRKLSLDSITGMAGCAWLSWSHFGSGELGRLGFNGNLQESDAFFLDPIPIRGSPVHPFPLEHKRHGHGPQRKRKPKNFPDAFDCGMGKNWVPQKKNNG